MMLTDESVALIVPASSHQDPEETENSRRINLYRAALHGDWKYKIDPGDIRAEISERKDTALHIGAMVKSCKFARKLLPKLDTLEELVVRNKSCNTAFCLAAASGKLELAKEMIEVAKKKVKEKKYGNLEIAMIKENENGNLTEEEMKKKLEEIEMMKSDGEYLAQVKGSNEWSPLVFAVLYGREEMVYWLYYLTKDFLNDDDRIELLLLLIRNGFHEFALQLLQEHNELATAYDKTEKKETALHVLAQLPVANQQGVWKRIKRCFNRFLCSIEKPSPEMKLLKRVWELAMSRSDYDKKSNILEVARKQIFVAAKRGNIEFLKILIREYPDLIFQKDNKERSIFHIAVKYRHVDIFRLIHEIGSFKDFIVGETDKKNNNILHFAAKLAPSDRLHSVSGVALQMQRELLWFKEVKKLMNPFDAEAENQDGKTPRVLFSERHQKLKKNGEKWMKHTANYCMVVATLITAMVFAATLAVPGGTSDETGTPHFLQKSSFKIFTVSDAVSLVLSTCSILTLLSILTSRYAEEDFLKLLPIKLLIGLGTLLLSIAAMMVAFCAAVFILFKDGVVWIPILVAAIGSLLVIFFIIQQVCLFIDVLRSTCKSSSIFKAGGGTLFS